MRARETRAFFLAPIYFLAPATQAIILSTGGIIRKYLSLIGEPETD